MQEHAKKYSQGYRAHLSKGTAYTFWSKDFDGMAFKTMLRQLISKWGIMSIEMQNAVEKDMGVINEDGSVDYVDNQNYVEQEPIINQEDKIVDAEVKASEEQVEQVDMNALLSD